MASGSFKGSIVNEKYALRVDWSSSPSTANNNSAVTCTMYLVQASGWKLSIKSRSDNSITINGVKKTWASAAIENSGGVTVKLATVTSDAIAHNADGTKSITISATFNIRATISGTYYSTITASATINLDTIPRATQPTLSASSANMGDTVTINCPRASSAFLHDLAYSFAGSDWVKIEHDVATTCSFKVPDLATSVPNATSGTMTIRCITLNSNGAEIGRKTVLLTAKVPTNVVPTISGVTTAEATAGIAARFGAFIGGKSKVKVGITAAGAKGSTIKAYSSTLRGTKYSGSSWTSDIIPYGGTYEITVTVTDSRGRTATKKVTFNVLAYTLPEIYYFRAFRVNDSHAADTGGKLIRAEFSYSVPSLNGGNTATAILERLNVPQDGAAEWQTIAQFNDLSKEHSAVMVGHTFSPDTQHDLRLTVTDYFGASSSYPVTLPTDHVIMDLLANGMGVAFGKVAEQDGVDFGWSTRGAVFGLWEATAEIPEGADLNDYHTPGIYSTKNNARAETLVNCPSQYGGTLRVYTALGTDRIAGAYAYLVQEYRSYWISEGTYRRLLSTDENGVWTATDWVDPEKVVPISRGGTGATTAAAARTNLGFGGKVLWNGPYFMAATHTITLSEPISAQPNGIVIVFSPYANNAAENTNFQHFFISKQFVALQPGAGSEFNFFRSQFVLPGCKYLYINDTTITGHANNVLSGTNNGISFNNNNWVLRYVFGV